MTLQTRAIRIAMLNADTPVPTVRAKQKTYGIIFHTLLSAAALRVFSDGSIKIKSTDFDVLRGEYPESLADNFDAILITGSAASSYDDAAWIHRLAEYVMDVYKNYPTVKIFGSCFGHQIICQSLLRNVGVIVERNPRGWEIGVHEMEMADRFRETFGYSGMAKKSSGQKNTISEREPTPDSMGEDDHTSPPIPSKLRLQLVHADHVKLPSPDALPESWINIGSTPRCDVQGVYEPGRVLTYQGHFEFDRFVNSETIKVFGATWEPEVLKERLEAADGDDDAELATEIVVRFLTETTRETVGSEARRELPTPPAEDW